MVWQVASIEPRFTELLRAVEEDSRQILTRDGAEIAVVLSPAEYRRPTGNTKETA